MENIIKINLKEELFITEDEITYLGNGMFTGDIEILSNHYENCCEQHYLDFESEDIPQEGSKFNTEEFTIEKIPYYGIALIPINGHPIRIPGYYDNNGFYSDNLYLIIKSKYNELEFDITECQGDNKYYN